MQNNNSKRTLIIGWIAIILVIIIFTIGIIRMGYEAHKDTEVVARNVSFLYLDELASRREQVVEANIEDRINDINTALDLMTLEDLSDMEHLRAYQAKMKRIYTLEKFAFVDEEGSIYTSLGMQYNIKDYSFNYKSLTTTDISILNLNSPEKKVIIAVPMPKDKNQFNGKTLVVCFMEIDMSEMLKGVSMASNDTDTTFCNIYTQYGIALSNTVLGGLAYEDNLLDALKNAVLDEGYTYENVLKDFALGRKGIVSFTYGDIKETLSYVPVKGTDWLLTYLIRESVITQSIDTVSSNIMIRNLIMSGITVFVLLLLFSYIIYQNNKNTKARIRNEAKEIEIKVKQNELQKKLELQNRLIEQNKLILALSSDYWGVYYIELDTDRGTCYQAHTNTNNLVNTGEVFDYWETVSKFAEMDVSETYRDDFLRFVNPNYIKKALIDNQVISYRYITTRNSKESYEMIKIASVRHPEDREGDSVHAVAICFTNVDEETKMAIAQNEMLSNALKAAEQASKAKTVFLSNMSHEIRTPMNAIIGLDNIALNDPNISLKQKEYLEKIGSSAEHLLNLINDILDMSRIESGRMVLKKEEFSFSKLIEYINTMFSGQAQEKGIDYKCYINGHIDDYYVGDNLKIRQVLINILGNAIKFTNTGGNVSLDVSKIAEYDNKSTLRFVVRDTGIGISKEYLPYIYDSFSQEDSSTINKYGSSGLGLAITKNIVEMMNGNISIDSTKGVGSTFTITITVDNSSATNSKNEVQISTKEMKVLVVDDDEVAIEHAKLVLGKAGVKCDIAYSGKEAIEKVKDKLNSKSTYNLILIDWKMPDMDGIETTRIIRSISGDKSAIIILTAYKWDDVLDDAIKAGVDSFIAKPLFANSVIEEFKEAIRRKNIISGEDIKKTSLSGKRILLAEDVEINAEIMQTILEMRQMNVEIAGNGKVAVEMYSSHPAYYYDAILMDMMMPEMDGLQATKIIRNMDKTDAKTIPIIALTANAFDEDVQRSLQAGLNAHLSKPVKPELVYETLQELIKH